MHQDLIGEIAAILAEGQDMTIATVRPDGWPQATTVSYASAGTTVYFGCGAASQKARNLAANDRVSLTVNLPYKDWSQIRGLSLSGRASRIQDAEELGRVGVLFMEKFPELAQYIDTPPDEMAMFRIDPEVASVLDYGKGFGHAELVMLKSLAPQTV